MNKAKVATNYEIALKYKITENGLVDSTKHHVSADS